MDREERHRDRLLDREERHREERISRHLGLEEPEASGAVYGEADDELRHWN